MFPVIKTSNQITRGINAYLMYFVLDEKSTARLKGTNFNSLDF